MARDRTGRRGLRSEVKHEEVPSLNYDAIKNGGEEEEWDVLEWLRYVYWMLNNKGWHPDRVCEILDRHMTEEYNRKRDNEKKV